jgi:AbrB family looped-hinge helix DNA binding protein
MAIIKVGRRGQITIPRVIRNYLDIEEGDRIAFVQWGGDVIVRPLKKTLHDLKGSVPVADQQNFNEIRRQVIADHVREIVNED